MIKYYIENALEECLKVIKEGSNEWDKRYLDAVNESIQLLLQALNILNKHD